MSSIVHVSPPYNRTDITIDWKNCIFVDNDKALDDHTLACRKCAKALLALAISASNVPSEVKMLPKYLKFETTSRVSPLMVMFALDSWASASLPTTSTLVFLVLMVKRRWSP